MPSKKTKKQSKSSIKPKLSSLDQTHGKEESKGGESKPTTLDQVWGDTGLWKYNTTKLNEYTQTLDEMTLSDIQAHASKIGLVPRGSRIQLTKKLIAEFKTFVSQYKSPEIKSTSSPKASPEALKILKEGQ